MPAYGPLEPGAPEWACGLPRHQSRKLLPIIGNGLRVVDLMERPCGTLIARCCLKPMPIYHFHVTDGRRLLDPRGLDLPDAEAAARYGQQLAEGFASVVSAIDGSPLSYVEIADEDGTLVTRVEIPSPKR
jgi:hypothetical protein